MNIHEHQAKDLLKEFGAPVSKGFVITSLKDVEDLKDRLEEILEEDGDSKGEQKSEPPPAKKKKRGRPKKKKE